MIELIDARGTAEPQGISTMFHIMISNILANTTGGVSLPVQYPAGPDQNTTNGENFVSKVIHEGLHRCPGQKYALFGYSQGATLMLKVLNRLDRDAIKMVKSVILVGNPYRLPGKMSNVNEKGLKDHSQSVGMFTAAASRQNSSASNIIPQLSDQLDKSGKVLDYCLAVSFVRYLSSTFIETKANIGLCPLCRVMGCAHTIPRVPVSCPLAISLTDSLKRYKAQLLSTLSLGSAVMPTRANIRWTNFNPRETRHH